MMALSVQHTLTIQSFCSSGILGHEMWSCRWRDGRNNSKSKATEAAPNNSSKPSLPHHKPASSSHPDLRHRRANSEMSMLFQMQNWNWERAHCPIAKQCTTLTWCQLQRQTYQQQQVKESTPKCQEQCTNITASKTVVSPLYNLSFSACSVCSQPHQCRWPKYPSATALETKSAWQSEQDQQGLGHANDIPLGVAGRGDCLPGWPFCRGTPCKTCCAVLSSLSSWSPSGQGQQVSFQNFALPKSGWKHSGMTQRRAPEYLMYCSSTRAYQSWLKVPVRNACLHRYELRNIAFKSK